MERDEVRRNHGLAVLALVVSLGLGACTGSDDNGGQPGREHPIGDGAIKAATVVAETDAATKPVDAAPSPDGSVVYYLTDGDRGPALLRVAALEGSPSTAIVEGAPLVKPTGIGVATDSSHVFVADQQALQDSVAGASGGILVVPTGTNPAGLAPATATLLAGTEGRSPRGLDVFGQSGSDVVWFTGTDHTDGTPGLFRVAATGGEVVTVAEGAPFVSPDSVVVTARGVAYVTDQGGGQGKGRVFRVSDGEVIPVLSDLRLGAPAGVTIANDDATLLVSSVDPSSGSDQVLFLDLASGDTVAATKVVGANMNSSGGLHKAHAAPVLAWSDVQRPGRVYRVDL